MMRKPAGGSSAATAGKQSEAGFASPARRARGSAAVHEDLREDILSLRISPGSAIDEVALAKRFGLSRTPIREALLMLAAEDLVTFLPGRSAIVTPHTLSNAHAYMDALMLLSRAIAKLAAEMRTEHALDAIRAKQQAYRQAATSSGIAEIAAADLAFHRVVALASGNEFLGKFYRLSLDYGRRMQLLHYYPIFGEAERSDAIASHAALVAAIADGDGNRAEIVAGGHVLAELRVVQRSLEPKVGARFALGPATTSDTI